MKKILFIDQDEEIRDYLRDYVDSYAGVAQNEEFNIRISATLVEAERLFDSEQFDGIVIDAIRPSQNKILPFIQKIRSKRPGFPIVAMVGFLDIVIDEKLKQSLTSESVKIVDKLKALQNDNIAALFKTCCSENTKEIS